MTGANFNIHADSQHGNRVNKIWAVCRPEILPGHFDFAQEGRGAAPWRWRGRLKAEISGSASSLTRPDPSVASRHLPS